jgi:peptidoglycan hydrolase-like protein with peptidoglycan-binding domain
MKGTPAAMPLTPHALAALLATILAVVLAPLGPARAQAPGAYVQIEAHRDPATARERAADWARDLPGISVFALPSGWSAIALGPYRTEAAARAALVELRAARRIPGDSYLTDATAYDRRIGGTGGTPPSLAPAPPLADPTEAVIAPGPAPAPAPATETLAEARAAERALDTNARADIQRALAWFEHYPGTIDAAFGPGTRRAIAAWQAAAGRPETGVLRSVERTALLAAWRAERDRLGLEEVTEAEAGIRVALPLGLVRRAGTEPPFVRYRGDDNGTVVLLLSQPGDALTLRAFYDIFQSLEAMPSDGPRRIDAGAFAIEGRDADRTAVAAAELDDGWVKGWLVAWPRAEDATMARALPALRIHPIHDLDGCCSP